MGNWIDKWGWTAGVLCLLMAGLNFYGCVAWEWGTLNLVAGVFALIAGIFNLGTFYALRKF